MLTTSDTVRKTIEDQYLGPVKRYRKSYLSRVRRSLKDLKQGRVRPHKAQTLIDELRLEA